jgi:phosphoserine phosphatase
MRLIAFDFDGTLSDSEMTVLLGERMGVADEMADITERAMNDEISYAQSLRKRASLLDGLDEERAAAAYDEVELRPGAAALVRRLRDAGHHVAIFTGGFERGVERALEKEGVEVDSVVANRLPVAGGRLTGEVEGPLVEGTKDEALEDLAAELDVDLSRTIAVGDGANDLPMLEVAGLAVGFVPKDAVRPACDVVVSSMYRLGKVFEGHNVVKKRDREE